MTYVLLVLRMMVAMEAPLVETVVDARPPTPCEQLEIGRFHPVEIGRWWRYHVVEQGRAFEQTVTVRESTRAGCVELYAESGLRKSRYVVSQDGEGVYLHEVGVRLALFPMWRTETFEPPLPFLLRPGEPVTAWTWQGKCLGSGPRLERGQYSSHAVEGSNATVGCPLLEVRAAWTLEDGVVESFVARYQQDVGLVSMESEGYHKELVSHGRKGS